MDYQMAPLEGLTTYIYRNAFQKYYGGISAYYTPFISPHKDKTLNSKEINEILPEHNVGINVIPQILTNSSEDFLKTSKEISQYGYKEINLNFGCPSGTVTSKKKGSGILTDLYLLESFLDEIFNKTDLELSIKTRVGFYSEEEWNDIFEIYKKFPWKTLIVHPRIREDYYQNVPRMKTFELAYEECAEKLIYNGNIFSESQLLQCEETYPKLGGIMLGRGLLAYPNLINSKLNHIEYDRKTLKDFHDEVLHQYQEVQSGDKNVLYRMKELWFYLAKSFEPMPKLEKEIRKAQKCSEYEMIVKQIFREVPFSDNFEKSIYF